MNDIYLYQHANGREFYSQGTPTAIVNYFAEARQNVITIGRWRFKKMHLKPIKKKRP